MQKEAPDDLTAQVALAWKLAFAQSAPDTEVAAAVQFVQQQQEQFQQQKTATKKDPKADPAAEKAAQELSALTSFCQALLSSNHFRSRRGTDG